MRSTATGTTEFAAPKTPNFPKIKLNRFWLYPMAVTIIASVTLVTYRPTLFNFFISDDYGMIAWLESSKHDLLFFKQLFHQWWLQEPYYYRPIATCILAIQYFLWGANGFYFRLSSIAGLLLSSLMVGLIAFALYGQASNETLRVSRRLSWAILSSALFALYPLHCEPVNWCVCQHDIYATCFSLLALRCYIQWRKSSAKLFLILSLFSTSLGLLCKETVAALPLVLFCYELICNDKSLCLSNEETQNRASETKSPLSRFKEGLIITVPFWLILSMYFFIRKSVLGVFLTNHALACLSNPLESLRAWPRSLQRIFVPIDISIIPGNSLISIAWQVTIISAIGLSAKAFKDSGNKRLAAFLVAWFILSLLPVFPVFMINGVLSNSRFAYLSTAPLCMFLTYGISNISFGFKYSSLIRAAGGILFALSALILYRNNQACALAGSISNRMVSEIKAFYRSIPDDPQVRILGLPTIESSWIFGGMTKKPFLDRDIFNCSPFYLHDQSYPFGLSKESIRSKTGGMKCLYWDDKSETLRPVHFYTMPPPLLRNWQGKDLRDVVQIENTDNGSLNRYIWENDGVLRVISYKPSSLTIKMSGLPCWPIDFIKFRIITAPVGKPIRPVALRFTNDIVPTYSDKDYRSWNAICHMDVVPNGKEEDLIFALRDWPNWAMGGKCRGLQLTLPANSDIRLMAISMPDAKTIIPTLRVLPRIKINHEQIHQVINFDASGINGCTRIALEVIPADRDFEKPYADGPDKNVLFTLRAKKRFGALDLCRAHFPIAVSGTYKARLRAIDKNGRQVGLCSDHFLIDVKK